MTQEDWELLLGVDESNDEAPIRGFSFDEFQEDDE